MTAAVIILGVIVAVLVLLVAGLLRSHALILRTLHEAGIDLDGFGGQTPAAPTGPNTVDTRQPTQATAITPGDAPLGRPAHDIAGATPDGGATAIAVRGVAHDTILLFLSADCATCQRFWDALGPDAPPIEIPTSARLIVVTKGQDNESPTAIAERRVTVPVVMSSPTWADHDVPGSPYAIHVDGPSGRIIGEGTGGSWPQVADLLARATSEDGHTHRGTTTRRSRTRRPSVAEQDTDAALLAAGILPGDPSLDRRADGTATRDRQPS